MRISNVSSTVKLRDMYGRQLPTASLENIVISSKGKAFILQACIRYPKEAFLPPPLSFPSPQCSLLSEVHLTLPSCPPTHSLTHSPPSTRPLAWAPAVQAWPPAPPAASAARSARGAWWRGRRRKGGREGQREGGTRMRCMVLCDPGPEVRVTRPGNFAGSCATRHSTLLCRSM